MPVPFRFEPNGDPPGSSTGGSPAPQGRSIADLASAGHAMTPEFPGLLRDITIGFELLTRVADRVREHPHLLSSPLWLNLNVSLQDHSAAMQRVARRCVATKRARMLGRVRIQGVWP